MMAKLRKSVELPHKTLKGVFQLTRLIVSVDKESSMPSSVDTAAQLTCGVLNNPNSQPTIIIIDALNQVTSSPVFL